MIGRKEESKLLKSLMKEEEPQFVAVFGRRRIGKTYLVRESFEHNFTFQHTGLSNSSIPAKTQKQAQLDKFEESLLEYGFKSSEKITSWNQAFNGLKEVIKNSKEKKKVIFIDELSWMDTRDSGLISALENFWNGWVTARKEKDIVLVVCASATYWIIDKIVNSRGGLHNRITQQINLKPFTLKECEEYLLERKISFNRHQILQCYMALGGVPYYWSLLQKGKSLAQNIDYLFFKQNAILGNEYDNLYSALFNSPEQYLKIIEALSSVSKGLTRDEVAAAAKINNSGDLSKKLRELENCGFIRKYVPYGQKNNGLYQLIDNYTIFYHKFLNDKTSDEQFWEHQRASSGVMAWSGIAFERVCLEHVKQIKAALGIAGVYTEAFSWKCQGDTEKGLYGSQIDLLIVRKDQIINLCEMKYAEDDYLVDSDFDKQMRRKINDFKIASKTKYAIHPTLVTTYGARENSYAENLQAVITAEDLFK